jgi:precorrin-6B C5,15-methyltransferase / cobalt-precorrin-6B C5,C15-methyltransferase
MIHVVGIGLNGALGLTEEVRQIIGQATILVGGDRHLSYFPDHRADKINLKDIAQTILEVKKKLQEGERIVILVSGDPLFFGLGRLLLENFPTNCLQFHPHLNSIQLAFNKIKIPWQDAEFISVHGRSLDELGDFLQQGTKKIAILTDPTNHPAAIARYYLSLDLPIQYDFWICEDLEGDAEKITHFPVAEIPLLAHLTETHFSALNVVILIRQDKGNLNLKELPLFGIADRDFLSFSDRPGLMTKREIRVMILAQLNLQPEQVIWDIGAGTGSVSIEIARLCPTAQVYAVEKTAMGINLIEQNCQRFQVANVSAIYGMAPNILQSLPSPERIFIGGSGGNLEQILNTCTERIAPQGTIVLALATLENIHQCLTFFTNKNWQYKLLQLQIARSVRVGDLTRLSPLNPVTIITANQP